MNLQNMQYLIEISDSGSLSAAAKRLSVTQPYLSKVLRETEKEYNLTIFTRGKTGIIPTESGRLFLDMSRDLIEHANHFRQTLKDSSDSCRLRISASSTSPANDALIRMVRELSDTPSHFFCREMTTGEVIHDLNIGHADIGVITYPVHQAEKLREFLDLHHLEEHILFSSGAQLLCRTDHPLLKESGELTPETLCQYGFVLCPDGASHVSAAESIYDDHISKIINQDKISRIIYISSQTSLYDVIRQTDYLGIGIFPACCLEKNNQIVFFPLPEWMIKESGQNADYICSYLFRNDVPLPKAAETYITALCHICRQDS